MSEPEECVARERRFWEAAGDPDFYREHFADYGRCVFGVGTLDKGMTVGSMEGAAEWSDVDMRDVSVAAGSSAPRAPT